MQQDVYADLLFLINFSMDYLCLYICARSLHRRIRTPRILLAAAIGGIYSVLALFLTFNTVLSILIDVAVCVILCAIVFADKSHPLSSTLLCTLLFVGISMMTGGCMTALFNLLNRLPLPLEAIEDDTVATYLFAALAAISGIISLRSGQLISRHSSITECLVSLTMERDTAVLNGLADTGNLVKDPLSGKAVILVDREQLSRICDITVFDSFASGAQAGEFHKFSLRLIPITTAGGHSMLVAAKPKDLTVTVTDAHGRTRTLAPDVLISPTNLKNSATGYKAIIPAEILKI
jgi:sigma-E processing peptidase SpoIIGA